MVDLIEKKRDGYELTTEEIQFFINGYTSGDVPDYQASAMAMAIVFQGMTPRECADLTMAMVHSGDTVDLSGIQGIKVDKHSTGGVGDTTTLILAPLIASLDIPMAKMSGRGLGHTGGTIDKLESIPGFHVELSTEQFMDLVNKNKVAVVGQTGNLTPADKKLYALRDVTGTVESIPLIASSIMSKKIAAGADAICLDVKTGSGAFMKTEEDAVKLAHAMVRIGSHVGRKTIAVISDMSQPLGFAVGNALEVKEAMDTLRGEGPEDLTELVLTLGSQMVVLAQKADTEEAARKMLEESIHSGKALQKFKEFVKSQGGDPAVVDHPEKLPQAQFVIDVPAKEDGVICEMVTDEIGKAAAMLGAGRAKKDDPIDLAAGLVLRKKIGDTVKKGETIVTLYSNRSNVEDVMDKLYQNIRFADHATAPKLIHEIVKD